MDLTDLRVANVRSPVLTSEIQRQLCSIIVVFYNYKTMVNGHSTVLYIHIMKISLSNGISLQPWSVDTIDLLLVELFVCVKKYICTMAVILSCG